MRKMSYRFINYLLSATVLIFAFQGCQKDEVITPDPPKTYQRAEISKISSLGVFSPDDIQQILNASGANIPFTLEYSVEALSVNYYSIDMQGNMIPVSGALFIPQQVSDLPLLSIQHGTETKRDRVASVSPNNSVEGIFGLLTASMGYMSLVPDYPGFGISTMNHPYMHAASLIPSVVDLMLASKQFAVDNQITLNGQVFLTGYSEGGFVSLITQKQIEEYYKNDFILTAVAPMSGPYDLKGTFDTIFQSGEYITPAYGAYCFSAYNEIYGWNRLSDMVNEPYASNLPGIFNGSMMWGEVLDELPASFTDLIKPSFRQAYNDGSEVAIISAISENTILDWSPQTPLHFIHGDADAVVPYQNTLTAIEKLSAKGAVDIQLTAIPGGTHVSSGPEAIILALEWIETF